MYDGFIPFSRASLMLDVVSVSMIVLVPLLIWSIYLVRFRRNYSLHRKINLLIASLLLIVVVLFEVDIRMYGWRHRAEASNLYETLVNPILYIHLFFAVTTTLLWIATVSSALRFFDSSPKPNNHSKFHRITSKLAAAGLLGTSATGWVFYVVAFMM